MSDQLSTPTLSLTRVRQNLYSVVVRTGGTGKILCGRWHRNNLPENVRAAMLLLDYASYNGIISPTELPDLGAVVCRSLRYPPRWNYIMTVEYYLFGLPVETLEHMKQYGVRTPKEIQEPFYDR